MKAPSLWCMLFHKTVPVVKYATRDEVGSSSCIMYVCPKCEPDNLRPSGPIDKSVLEGHDKFHAKITGRKRV